MLVTPCHIYKYVSINGYLARINRFQGLTFRAFVAYEKLS